jgi:hypothetical protein
MVTLAEKKAEYLGFNLPEYVRYLIAKDIERSSEIVEIATPELEKEIGNAIKEYKKNGPVKRIKTEQQLKAYLTQIS